MKITPKFILTVCLLLAIKGTLTAQPRAVQSGTFRITAYIELDDDATDRTVPYKDINYLNIAFINPDKTTGKLLVPDAAKRFIRDARHNGVKVLAVIGGENAPRILSELIAPENRDAFIADIIQVLQTDSFDGVDIDLEKHLVNRDYPGFIKALVAALKPLGLEVTAAVCTDFVNTKNYCLPGMMDGVDFVNIMSYDKFADKKPGQQATYELADADIAYWHYHMHVKPECLGVGVPFYGWLWPGPDQKRAKIKFTSARTRSSFITENP
jgi:GH18 family chitinase